jgi:hypothetical protein
MLGYGKDPSCLRFTEVFFVGDKAGSDLQSSQYQKKELFLSHLKTVLEMLTHDIWKEYLHL